MPDIIGIGASVYDTLMQVEAYPREDTKVKVLQTRIQGGGPCATALVAAARLGVSAAYMGVLGDDAFGQYMLEDFRRYGVDTACVRQAPGATSFHAVIWLSQATASRTCVWNSGTVPPLDPSEVNEAAIRAAKWLHLDGHALEAACHAAKVAKACGVKVSLDAGGVRPGLDRLLPLVDALIPSEEFALQWTGAHDAETAAERLWAALHPEILAVTQGSRGGLLYDAEGLRRYPAFPVQAVDTNGAGDAFHGAFLAACVQGLAPMDCARYASAVSALKCMGFGARASLPTDSQTRAFLRERGVVLNG